ncbi:cutinase family protein [Rhodococcus sp. BP-252]|uniref:cutinase family protein n=1 Tax=unclassified Rhodococcus (in: high G+C Gram-positive bacteria) TaxID=192944 RepID=UPI001C9AA1D1|nr:MULTISPECIES: cutinase family protein [unclassified Rhodococcus (in: high G+C Gram-positive bacteria)]MBY6412867.1 cutinase family protein [Rhodococcus sp. BP-320]MBY6417596.1 cutinase family protein [Rhodococcus sp. BP-321]MBY6423032.1 cutinase family protein [Rhodococcus sp. BP-324]MBY6427620.1 cutinase family protein [Rhodococcus sp. BP-323]MBY6432784.1 cutinase family protein [Rhodococcus sp. BP-322]
MSRRTARAPRRRAAVTFGAVLAAIALVATAAPAGAAPAQASAAACAKYVAVMTPGTWETNAAANPTVPVGMLKTVGNALKAKYGNQIDVLYPAYSASAFDQGRTYADSKQTGIDSINNILTAACATSKFLLAGYSQGADAAGDVAAAIGNGRGVIPAARILGVGLVADPHQGTAGGTLVGPKVDGQGIGGVRPEGFGSLAPLVRQLCAPTDLYCSTNTGTDGLITGLGKVLANPTDSANTTSVPTSLTGGATTQGGVTGASAASTTGQAGTTATTGAGSDFGSSLVSDFSRVDLAGATSTVAGLSDRIAALPETIGANRSHSQVAGVEASATSVANTLAPVADIQSVISANPGIRSSLDTAADGTPERQTATVLDALDQIDVPATTRTATSIADSASSILGGTAATTGLADSATSLTSQIAPLQAVAPDALTSATRVLSLLKPKTVVGQIVNVATGFSSLDYQGIIANLIALPQRVAALDVHESHRIAGELNNQFAPIVKMAAGVDLHTLAALVAMIPDPSGSAQIASLVLGLLGNVDVIRLANDVGAIQEVGWKILETGNLAAAAELLPIGLDLASVAAGVITGNASETSVDQLGARTQVSGQSAAIGQQASTGDFAGLAGSLVSLASSPGASDLTELVDAGIDAATFFASGAHQSYADFQVDSTGRSALHWLIDFFTQKIGG